MNEVLKAIRERRSIRSYRAEQIKEKDLDAILEAGTWAASGKGAQSAVMVVIQDQETIQRMSRANAEIWGRPDIDPFYAAPTAVVVLADSEQVNWLQDGSLVMGNLMLAAHSLGLGSCWINRTMEYFDSPDGRALLREWGLPEQYRGVGTCVLGYIDGEIPQPDPRKEGYIIRK